MQVAIVADIVGKHDIGVLRAVPDIELASDGADLFVYDRPLVDMIAVNDNRYLVRIGCCLVFDEKMVDALRSDVMEPHDDFVVDESVHSLLV